MGRDERNMAAEEAEVEERDRFIDHVVEEAEREIYEALGRGMITANDLIYADENFRSYDDGEDEAQGAAK